MLVSAGLSEEYLQLYIYSHGALLKRLRSHFKAAFGILLGSIAPVRLDLVDLSERRTLMQSLNTIAEESAKRATEQGQTEAMLEERTTGSRAASRPHLGLRRCRHSHCAQILQDQAVALAFASRSESSLL